MYIYSMWYLLVKVYGVVEECWVVDEVKALRIVGHFGSLQQRLADLDARSRAEALGIPQVGHHGHQIGIELLVYAPVDMKRQLWNGERVSVS